MTRCFPAVCSIQGSWDICRAQRGFAREIFERLESIAVEKRDRARKLRR